jgi:tetratricopeptide (TPR) repeat protein
MSLLAATQIPKPADEQAFERASIVLWRGLLGDPNVQRNGRRGQRQNGVDLFGVRNGDPAHHVGIQCKLKSDGHVLTADEVRDEVRKALTFRPELREYFIITTAPDDVALQELARELAVEQKAKGRSILIYVWGWNTLEERISENAAARKQFDPDYGAFSEKILDEVGKVAVIQEDIKVSIDTGLSQLDARFARFETLHLAPGDATSGATALEAQLDADIDEYRNLANAGKPRTALPLLERLLTRVEATASGRILFRIKANIGSCLLALGENERAAQLLSDAFDHAPAEPKAITNKAFSLLLQGRWQELLPWGREALAADPTNEGLAGYLVQAARFDPAIEEPLDLIPDGLKGSAAVAVGRVDVLRHRGLMPEWWQAARAALATHPDDRHARQFAAEADLDEILRDTAFQHTHMVAPQQRERIAAAAVLLRSQWDDARASEGVIKPEDAAQCCNIIVAYHALDDLHAAIEVARQGLAVAPDDVEIANRAAVAAIDGNDEEFAEQLLHRLPAGPDATVLAFRFYSGRADWKEVARIHRTQSDHIPAVERSLIVTAGRLAEIKVAQPNDIEKQIMAIAGDVVDDARASIVVADFARMEGFESVSDAAYRDALKCIDADSHFAPRMMVAMHASRRGEANVVADLLDGQVAEDHDNEALRVLARAFVNDSPIRRRAIRFFERLPAAIKELSFYLHAEGLLHFNRGDLKQAETCLRRAVEVSPDLTNYLALFSTLRRSDRRDEVKPILESLDLATVRGTPGQKMSLAQELLAADLPKIAFALAYDVLQSARNDPDAALRYFGLMMLDPNARKTPRSRVVGMDAWVRLEGSHGEAHSFLVADGPDRPADGLVSASHPLAAAAMGLKVGDEFTIKAALGDDTTWRVAEIKHKYLHALHDVMANFQTRFPDAKGFYTLKMKEGDVQPALDQVKKVSESNRKLADLYLLQHLPMAMVASRLGRDAVGFAEYVRSLDHDIETCVGNAPERDAAREIINRHRAAGAVLDTYTAWTVATMDAFDVLLSVFGKLVIPRSSIDELRSLRDKDDLGGDGRSMTIAWHNGQYIRQEFTREDIQVRDRFIAEQIEKIEKFCEIIPGAASDMPSELATILTETFGSDVLDPPYIGIEGYVLVSEDLYYRQIASAAVGAELRSVWLQPTIAFARESGLIDQARHAEITVKLARRRHSHVSIDAETLWQAWQADGSEDLREFHALTAFIGTRNAELMSHLSVVFTFLERIWVGNGSSDRRTMRVTGIVLEQLIRFRQKDWAMVLALVADGTPWKLREYVDQWVVGHFLELSQLREAEQRVIAIHARSHMTRMSRGGRRA